MSQGVKCLAGVSHLRLLPGAGRLARGRSEVIECVPHADEWVR